MKRIFTAFLLAVCLLGGISSYAQNIWSEDFSSTTFAPTGWITQATSGSATWSYCSLGSCGTNCGTLGLTPHSSPGYAYVYFWGYTSGNNAGLFTKAIPLQNYSNGVARITYWIFKENCTYINNSDRLEVWVSNQQSWTSGTKTLLGTEAVYCSPGSASWGTTVSNPGWYSYTYDIPSTYNSGNAYIIFNGVTNYGYDLNIDDVSINWVTPCTAPSAGPTNLVFNPLPTASTIFGSFTAASPAPTGGYVVVRSSGAFSGAPVNGVIYTPGSAIGNNGTVAYVGTATNFADVGLPPLTTYTYTIFPYTAGTPTCSGPAYRTSTPLSGTASTVAFTTYIWYANNGNGGYGLWTTPTNWYPTRTTPDPTDVLEFQDGVFDTAVNIPTQAVGRILFTNNTSVWLRPATATAATLTIADNNANLTDLEIGAGSNVYLDGSAGITIKFSGNSPYIHVGGSLEFDNSSSPNSIDLTTGTNTTLTVDFGGTLACGLSNAAACVSTNYPATPGNLTINGTYNHKYTTASGPSIPYANWGTQSSVLISGYTNLNLASPYGPGGATPVPPNWKQKLYNVTYNCPNQLSSTNVNLLGGPPVVLTNLNIISTGAGSVMLADAGTTYNDTINNFNQLGGIFDLAGATAGTPVSQTLNVGGTFSESGGKMRASYAGASPSVTLNFYGSQGKSVTFCDSVKGPVIYHISTPINLNCALPLCNYGIPATFAINANGGMRVTTTSLNPVTTSMNVSYSPLNTTLTYDTTGTSYVTSKTFPVFPGTSIGSPFNMTVGVGLGNTVRFPPLSNAAQIGGTLKFISGDIDLGNDSMIIGTSTAAPGAINDSSLLSPIAPIGFNPVINSNMGNIRMGVNGSLTRFFTSTTTAVPTVSSGNVPGCPFNAANIRTTPGFFPISYGTENRNVIVYFSAPTAVLNGGSITLKHNPTTGLQAPVPFPIYDINPVNDTIDKETKATWTFVTGGGISLTPGNTLGLKISAASLFVPINPSKIRLMHPSVTPVPGIHIGGSAIVAITNTERQGLLLSDLSIPFCMGANHVDILGLYTAINSGPWRVNSTWDINQPPSIADVAVINPNVTVTTDTNSTPVDTNRYFSNSCRSLTIYGTMDNTNIINGSKKLTIDSSILNFGVVKVGGTDTLALNGTTAQLTNLNGFNNNGLVSISGSSLLTMGGGIYLNNKPFNNNGSLNVSGGTMYINGNLGITPNSNFTQSGGSIVVDGNGGSNPYNSVLANTPIVRFSSPSITLTGGTLTILDPHAATNAPTNSFQYDAVNNLTDSPSHTFIFGDTLNISSDHNPGGTYTYQSNPRFLAPWAFFVNTALSSGRFTFSNLIVAGTGGTNAADSIRWFVPRNIINVKNNLTVYNKGEYRMNQYELYLNGNLTVNPGGIFTADSPGFVYTVPTNSQTDTTSPVAGHQPTVLFAQYNQATPAAPLPATQFQTLNGGSGSYRNSVNTNTAMLRNITVKNSNWVQFNAGNVVFSGGLTFMNVNGAPSRISTPGSTLTEYAFQPGKPTAYIVNAGTLNGWVVGGSYAKYGTNNTITPGPLANYLYPIGDSNNYTPATIIGTGNLVTAAGYITAKVYNAPYSYIGTSIFNPLQVVSRYWNISVNNLQFIPGTLKVKLQYAPTDPSSTFVPAYARIGLDSGANGSHAWSYPPTTNGSNFAQGSGFGLFPITIPASPQFNGNYVIADTCPPTYIVTQPGNQSGCIGGSAVQFCVNATGAALTYQWYFNNVPIPSANQPCYTIANPGFADTGHYQVRVLSICAPPQLSQAAVLTIGTTSYIYTQPLSVTGCANHFCDTLRFTSSGTANSVTWFHNGNIVATGLNRDSFVICPVTINDSGVYYATIWNGCALDSTIVIHVNVNPQPPANIIAAGPVSFCAGNGVVLNASLGAGYSYQWFSSCGPLPNAIYSYYTANSTCTYSVVVTDANGCTDTSAGVNVNAAVLPAPVNTTLGNTTFCQGGFDTLKSTGGAGYIYQWQVSQGGPYNNIGGAIDTMFIANASGKYRMRVTNSNNCVGFSNPILIIVLPNPADSITTSGPTSICNGTSVSIFAPIGSGYTYQWRLNGIDIAGATNYFYSANSGGQYKVVVAANGCTDSSVAIPVSIKYAPPAQIITPADGTHICELNTTTLNANTGTNYLYQWKKNGVNIPGATSPFYVDSLAGAFTVSISRFGCDSLSAPTNIFVDPLPNAIIQQTGNILTAVGVFGSYQWYLNSATINGATLQTYHALQNGIYTVKVTDSTTNCSNISQPYTLVNLGVNSMGKASDIRVFPNPATKIINIDAPYSVNVTISSVDGKVIIDKKDIKSIDISDLANGVYMMRISDKSGAVVKMEKLVKADN